MIPQYNEQTYNEQLSPHESVILVNSFVASQRIAAFFRRKAFSDFVQHIYNKGDAKIMLIGSNDDVHKKVLYSYHHDMRGAYTIKDLITLMSSGKIDYVITHDSFVAHLASIYNVPLKLFVKSSHRLGIIKERFVPFSQFFENKIDFF